MREAGGGGSGGEGDGCGGLWWEGGEMGMGVGGERESLLWKKEERMKE